MKLYTSITSPYSRAIMLTALSQGMDGLALAYADPWTTPPELTAVNPLSQVPALLTDDGTVICGTAFVADYLFGHPLHSAQQAALERQALDEARFRFDMNEDAMATEKLAEGIRAFVADARTLDTMLAGAQ